MRVTSIHTKLPLQERTARTVKQFHYTDWSETHTPESGIPLIKMMTMVSNRGTVKVVRHPPEQDDDNG